MKDEQTLIIIDDNPEICKSLKCLFESIQLKVETYHSCHAFLEHHQDINSSCIIVDVRMPQMGGLELLEHLKLQKNHTPVIVITGHGDIEMAVRAMKLGAVDFLIKPFNHQILLETVQRCINQSQPSNTTDITKRISRLSKRELQIIDLILEGKLNKEIAYELSISMSTVEAHRANIMQKMQAKTIAHLTKLYLEGSRHDG